MVAVRMGDYGTFDRPPWIDMKITRWTVQSFGTHDDQVHAHELLKALPKQTACGGKRSRAAVPDYWNKPRAAPHCPGRQAVSEQAARSALADDLVVSDFDIQTDTVAILPKGMLRHAGFVFCCQL